MLPKPKQKRHRLEPAELNLSVKVKKGRHPCEVCEHSTSTLFCPSRNPIKEKFQQYCVEHPTNPLTHYCHDEKISVFVIPAKRGKLGVPIMKLSP
jgi:hypothetical protein